MWVPLIEGGKPHEIRYAKLVEIHWANIQVEFWREGLYDMCHDREALHTLEGIESLLVTAPLQLVDGAKHDLLDGVWGISQ